MDVDGQALQEIRAVEGVPTHLLPVGRAVEGVPVGQIQEKINSSIDRVSTLNV